MNDDQREKILDCARDIYVSEGLQGLSMRNLARCVGVSAPAIYRHFQDKDELLGGVVAEALRTLAGYLYGALEGDTPMDRLQRAGEGYLNFVLEHPKYHEIISASPGQLGIVELSEEVLHQAQATGQFWVDRVRECMDSGDLEEEDPRSVALTLWGMAHGLISLYQADKLCVDEEGFRVLYRDSFRRLFRGMVPRESATTA